jgi:hypothetical protein
MDLVLCLPKVHWEAGPEAPGILEGRNAVKQSWQQTLARALTKEPWVQASSLKIIGNTAIPVLKLRTRADSDLGAVIALDVSFEGRGHKGLEANKYISALMALHPTLRPLVLVLKYFLSKRSLGESFTGGLSSYALLLMMVRFLQETSPQNSAAAAGDSGNIPVSDLGALFLGFLGFFGGRFDPRKTGISVKRRCFFSRFPANPASALSYGHAIPAELDGGGLRRHNSMYQVSSDMTVRSPAPTYVHSSSSTSTPSSGPHGQSGGVVLGYAGIQYKFDPLYIDDPLDRRNNVGRNCFRVYQVLRSFSEAYNQAMSLLRKLETTPDEQQLNHSGINNKDDEIIPRESGDVTILSELIGNYDELV